MGFLKFTKDEYKKIVVPLAKRLVNDHKGETLLVGMQGGQGTGKTTISKFLTKELKSYGYKVVRFSIDDFYLSWDKRKRLMKKHSNNPFYQISRGMPGTHRVKDLYDTLKKAKQGKAFSIPIFDKSLHNGKGDIIKKTVKVKGKLDFLILEGWNVGLPDVSLAKLSKICKKYKINLQRGSGLTLQKNKVYKKIWKILQYYIQVLPDKSNLHYQWRLLQEKRLIRDKGKGMSLKEIKHFTDIYLPLTYVCYDQIKADAIIKVDKRHNYYKLFLRK
tara:strand:+ start:16121 stop:16942 length:822 start_codon:yes stop_codon:yes gene_type:complete